MIHIIITSYGELNSTEKAIKSFLDQKITKPFKIIVADPYTETKWMLEEKFFNEKKIEYFEDEDKGKSYALNMLMKKIDSKKIDDIIIFSDGDVYVGNNSVNEILKKFEDPNVGCVCGRPISLNKKSNMLGYWSHVAFEEMNSNRKRLSNSKEFFEVSGYLFAIRNGIIKSFPIGASEDNVIPMLIRKNEYKVEYAERAEVFVMSPKNFNEWKTQKNRNIKGHLALRRVIGHFDKRKNTIFGEAWRGLSFFFKYPNNIKEYFWYVLMAFSRLYVWMSAAFETDILEKKYSDGWRSEENLKTTKIDD